MSGEIIPIDEYHASPALGSTTIKRALTHPERMHAPTVIAQKTREEGHRLHCAVLEPDQMHIRYAVAPNPDDYPNALRTSDDLKGALRAAGVKGYSAKKREALADMVRESIPGAVLWADVLSEHGKESGGKTFVSAEEWDQMHRAADAAMAHPVIKSEGIFTEGVAERSFFADLTYSEPGIYGRAWPMKARPDWLQSDRVVDLKSTSAESPAAFIKQANALHYDLSAAVYLDVLRECGHRCSKYTWVAIEKRSLHSGGRVMVHVVTMAPSFIEQGREKLSVALDRINEWESNPQAYDRRELIEHIAEAPAWGWR